MGLAVSGTKNSGRRKSSSNVVDFSGTTGAAPAAPASLERPLLSEKAAAHWDAVVSEAGESGPVLPSDRSALAKICEQLVTMDFIIRAKSQKRFNPLTDRGLRVSRLERQTTKEIERLWKSARKDIEARGNARPVRNAAAAGGQTPTIRDFALRRGPGA
jgi:hypothetical protein